MPNLKQVPSLVDLSIEGLSDLVEAEVLRVAHYVVKHYMYDEFEAAVRGVSEAEVRCFELLVTVTIFSSYFLQQRSFYL